MKPRLAQPLIAALVGGALVASGVVAASPAYAGTTSTRTSVLAAEPDPSASVPVEPTEDPSTPAEESSTPAADPSSPSDAPSTPADDSSSPAGDPSSPSGDPSSPSEEPSTPPADTEKPTGKFRLNLTSIATGQRITFGQTAAEYGDTGTEDKDITRIISWGDGATTKLEPTQTSVIKQYGKVGRFPVTETLTDPAGNVTTVTAYVTVANPSVKTSTSASSVWNHQRFTYKVSAAPAGTKRVGVYWGDGNYTSYAWAGKALSIGKTYMYYGNTWSVVSGKRQVRVAFYNGSSWSNYFNSVPVTVKKDSSKPKITITKPSSPDRLKSWKYVRGTASDKGAGIQVVSIFLEQYAGGKSYCLNSKGKWQYATDDTWGSVCYAVVVKVSKGKWSYKVPAGLKKGYFWADARAWDWADNHSGWKTVNAKITRS